MLKKVAILIIVLCSISYSYANATLLNLSYTGDNNITSFGLYDSSGNLVYDFFSILGPDNGKWTVATTASLEVALVAGQTYRLAWGLENYQGKTTSSNPMAFLGEYAIDDSPISHSDASWLAGTSLTSLFGAVDYGFNGAANIWTKNFGKAVSGISTEASWIGLGKYPGSAETMYVSTSFTVPLSEVNAPQLVTPEPGTMLLVGLGLSGMGLLRKRAKRQPV